MDAFVEVTKPDGSSELFPLEGAQVTLGRSGTAGVSLPMESQLELEHVLLAPRGKEGCWVSVSEGAATPVLAKGKAFASGMVKWGTELTIGSLRLRLTNKRTATKSENGISPVLLVALVVVLGGAGWFMLQGGERHVPSQEGMDPPALFFAEGTCPAGRTGSQVEQFADSRGDRYPYDPRDGVAAIGLYKDAAACFTTAGDNGGAQRSTRNGEQLQRTVEADYAARRLRLDRALAGNHWIDAQREASALVALTTHIEDDDWVAWLTRINRISEARASKLRGTKRQR